MNKNELSILNFSDVLFKLLQNANLEKRGPLLREICIIDEQLKNLKPVDNTPSTPTG